MFSGVRLGFVSKPVQGVTCFFINHLALVCGLKNVEKINIFENRPGRCAELGGHERGARQGGSPPSLLYAARTKRRQAAAAAGDG